MDEDWFQQNAPKQEEDWFAKNAPKPVDQPQQGGVVSGIVAGLGRALNPINLVKGALDIGHESDISNIVRYGKTLGEIVTGKSPDEAIGKNIPELQQQREAAFGQQGTREQSAYWTGAGLQLGLVAAPFLHGRLKAAAPEEVHETPLAEVAGIERPSPTAPVTPETPIAATEPVAAEPIAQPVQEAVTPPTAAPQLPLVEPEPVVQTGATGTGEGAITDAQLGVPPIVSEMFSTLRNSVNDLTSRVSDVKWGKYKEGDKFNKIQFKLDGVTHEAELKGRNRDFVLSDNPEVNKALATRTILDEHATKTGNETPVPRAEIPATAPFSTETIPTGEPNAVQIESPSSVLPHPQEGISEAGGERIGVGQGVQGEETPQTGVVGQERPIAETVPQPEQPISEQPKTVPTPAETHAASNGEDPIGIAERYREEQQPGSVIPGIGRTADEARAWGHDFINKGGNPYDVVANKGTKRELWQDVGVVRAEYERLSNEKRAAESELESNPNDPQARMAFENADLAQRQWSKDAQPVLTRAGDALRAASRSYPREINSFSDFTDIVNDHFKGEVELTPEKRAELQKAVKAIKKGNLEATEARSQVTNEAVKKAGGKVMSFDDLKTSLTNKMTKLLEDCVI